nr:helix-turn-helix transcriptional regulator [Liquorilactobacillus satsumensis]
MEINQILKSERKKLKLTQAQVAAEIFVSQKSISNWENGHSFPDIDSLIRLASLYHLSLDNILLEDSKMVKDLKEKTDLNAMKKIQMTVSITNSLLILVVCAQSWLGGELSLPTTVLISLVIMLNIVSTVYFSKLISRLDNAAAAKTKKKRQIVRFLIFAIIFGGCLLIGTLLN